jgi:hypothetical protein
MPYIIPSIREEVDVSIYHVAADIRGLSKSVLTYTIFKLMKLWVFTSAGDFNYQNMSDACAAARDAEHEFRRRYMDPYEDKKIQENGDI